MLTLSRKTNNGRTTKHLLESGLTEIAKFLILEVAIANMNVVPAGLITEH